MLYIKTPYRSQPTGISEVADKYASGVAGIWLPTAFNSNPRELLKGFYSTSNNYGVRLTERGKSMTLSAALASSEAFTFIGQNPNAAIVFTNTPGDTARRPFFAQRNSGGGAQIGFGANYTNSFAGAVAGDLVVPTLNQFSMSASSTVDGSWSVYGYSIFSATFGQLFKNGVPVTTSTSGSGLAYNLTANFTPLAHQGMSASNAADVVLMALFNRALSFEEHAELGRNPWLLFERRIWIPTAAAAPGGITGPLIRAFPRPILLH